MDRVVFLWVTGPNSFLPFVNIWDNIGTEMLSYQTFVIKIIDGTPRPIKRGKKTGKFGPGTWPRGHNYTLR
jgi:hypothetical protein